MLPKLTEPISNEDAKVPVSSVQYVNTNIGGYSVLVPDFSASWAPWANWEREVSNSMEKLLKKGDVFFDVGAADGSLSVLWGRFVGGENVVLFESLPDTWTNIKTIWEKNGMAPPKATYCGLVGDKTFTPKNVDFDQDQKDGWPIPAFDGRLLDKFRCRYIWEHDEFTPQITLDDFVSKTGIIPSAISIDVEGAEINVLRGAIETLKKYKPKVWASLHRDLENHWSQWGFDFKVQEVHDLMKSLGYSEQHLATDHEEHWLFI